MRLMGEAQSAEREDVPREHVYPLYVGAEVKGPKEALVRGAMVPAIEPRRPARPTARARPARTARNGVAHLWADVLAGAG